MPCARIAASRAPCASRRQLPGADGSSHGGSALRAPMLAGRGPSLPPARGRRRRSVVRACARSAGRRADIFVADVIADAAVAGCRAGGGAIVDRSIPARLPAGEHGCWVVHRIRAAHRHRRRHGETRGRRARHRRDACGQHDAMCRRDGLRPRAGKRGALGRRARRQRDGHSRRARRQLQRRRARAREHLLPSRASTSSLAFLEGRRSSGPARAASGWGSPCRAASAHPPAPPRAARGRIPPGRAGTPPAGRGACGVTAATPPGTRRARRARRSSRGRAHRWGWSL